MSEEVKPLTAEEIDRIRNGWREETVTTKEWIATITDLQAKLAAASIDVAAWDGMAKDLAMAQTALKNIKSGIVHGYIPEISEPYRNNLLMEISAALKENKDV